MFLSRSLSRSVAGFVSRDAGNRGGSGVSPKGYPVPAPFGIKPTQHSFRVQRLTQSTELVFN